MAEVGLAEAEIEINVAGGPLMSDSLVPWASQL